MQDSSRSWSRANDTPLAFLPVVKRAAFVIFLSSAMITFDGQAADKSGAATSAPSSASPGIAAQYLGDIGIERDDRVMLAENFEAGTIGDLSKRWSSVGNPKDNVLTFHHDTPPGGGQRSLQVTATIGENTGGYLYAKLNRAVDKMYARFYVKFSDDPDYIHHFVALGGYHPPTPWPQGGAGERPRGDDRIYIGIEPHGSYGRVPPPGAWNFYNYWHEMKGSADGRFWGNAIGPETPLAVPRGRWQCVEVMAQLNSAPDKSDGELTLWLDGTQAMHIGPGTRHAPWSGMGFRLPKTGGEEFAGFRWRNNLDLKLNWFWLMHYVTESAARQNRAETPSRPNRVWFDNIVVATSYIGPIKSPP
jgi:hypothetical protein